MRIAMDVLLSVGLVLSGYVASSAIRRMYHAYIDIREQWEKEERDYRNDVDDFHNRD